MSAEPYSASLVSRLSINEPANIPQGYFRSRLFIAPYTTNPLIAAADPLFSLLERLCVSQTLPDITNIRNNIDHELRAFHSKLSAADYNNEIIAIAHYLICAATDEVLGKSYLRLYGKAAEFKAFTPLTNDEVPPQKRFFDIVNFLKERPTQYLDLLELSYFCLIGGFEGEQHLRSDGRQYLDNLIEELYLLIQKHRVHKVFKLHHESSLPKISPKNHRPTLIAVLLSVLVVFSFFWLSHFFLENKAKTVLFGHFQAPMGNNHG